MKFKKIDPTFIGCATCSTTPVSELSLECTFDTDDLENSIYAYIGDTELYIFASSQEIKRKFGSTEIKLSQLVQLYSDVIERTDAFTIECERALNGEIYEYCKDTKSFYLVKQTNGYA